MNRIRIVLIVIAALAVPAALHTMNVAPKQPACFVSGASTYQIVPDMAAPDYRVRIDSEAKQADLRMQLVDTPERADFVLVDDAGGGEPDACNAAKPIRTVALDGAGGKPAVTVHLSTDAKGADYRLYVRSARFSEQDAAALLAAMWKAGQSRQVASRTAH